MGGGEGGGCVDRSQPARALPLRTREGPRVVSRHQGPPPRVDVGAHASRSHFIAVAWRRREDEPRTLLLRNEFAPGFDAAVACPTRFPRANSLRIASTRSSSASRKGALDPFTWVAIALTLRVVFEAASKAMLLPQPC